MLASTNAIVLSKLKYRDNDLIVKCYTQQFGVISFLLRGVLKKTKGNIKAAYFQSLSQLQLVIIYKSNRDLQIIKEVKLNHFYSSIHSNIIKSTVVMFLSEVLSSILKEEEQNETLYRYIETTLLWFDTHSLSSNFHLLFLLNLTKYLGFYPEGINTESKYFNLEDGKFQNGVSGKNLVYGENLNLLKTLLGITFDTLNNVKINAKQRQQFLSKILLYLELHLGSFKTPKSLQVFNQVFN